MDKKKYESSRTLYTKEQTSTMVFETFDGVRHKIPEAPSGNGWRRGVTLFPDKYIVLSGLSKPNRAGSPWLITLSEKLPGWPVSMDQSIRSFWINHSEGQNWLYDMERVFRRSGYPLVISVTIWDRKRAILPTQYVEDCDPYGLREPKGQWPTGGHPPRVILEKRVQK